MPSHHAKPREIVIIIQHKLGDPCRVGSHMANIEPVGPRLGGKFAQAFSEACGHANLCPADRLALGIDQLDGNRPWRERWLVFFAGRWGTRQNARQGDHAAVIRENAPDTSTGGIGSLSMLTLNAVGPNASELSKAAM